MIMLALEYWSAEALIITAGYLGELELGASVTLLNIIALSYTIPVGFSFAANTLVGNNLGASRPDLAKMYVNISIGIAVFLSVIMA